MVLTGGGKGRELPAESPYANIVGTLGPRREVIKFSEESKQPELPISTESPYKISHAELNLKSPTKSRFQTLKNLAGKARNYLGGKFRTLKSKFPKFGKRNETAQVTETTFENAYKELVDGRTRENPVYEANDLFGPPKVAPRSSRPIRKGPMYLPHNNTQKLFSGPLHGEEKYLRTDPATGKQEIVFRRPERFDYLNPKIGKMARSPKGIAPDYELLGEDESSSDPTISFEDNTIVEGYKDPYNKKKNVPTAKHGLGTRSNPLTRRTKTPPPSPQSRQPVVV